MAASAHVRFHSVSMQASGIVVFLFSYLAVFGVQTRSETDTWSLHPSWELLQDVLSAIGKAVDYAATQVENLNLDGIVGLRAVDDQFSLLLERYGPRLENGSALESDLLATLNEQRWKAREASQVATAHDQKSQAEYFGFLGSILKKGHWGFDFPLRTLGAANRTWPQLEIPFLWNNSDSCLNEVLGSSTEISPFCDISDFCWRVMTFPTFTMYGITHQLLYLEVGEMAGCGSSMSNFSMTYGQGSVGVIQNYLCSHILSEAKDIQVLGYPEKFQDLFLEQIFLCGVLGYQEFLTKDWLDEVFSLQDSSGCYKIHEETGNKVKREERRLKGDCGAHKTSVALGALTAYARFLLVAMMEN